MLVKDILKEFNLNEETHPCIKSIDFAKLENFVSLIISSLISKYGMEKIKLEIQKDDNNSPIIWIITYIIEVGGVKVIMDSHLETNNQQDLQSFAFIACVALNFALNKELKKHGLNKSDSYFYYNIDTLKTLIERVILHVLMGNPHSRTHFELFVNDMIKANLFNRL